MGYGSVMRLLHIGVKGRVIAIDKARGDRVWETRLKGAQFTNLYQEGNRDAG